MGFLSDLGSIVTSPITGLTKGVSSLLGSLGGGGGGAQQTALSGIDARFDPYIYGPGGALEGAKALYNSGGASYYPGKTVAPFSANELAGQQALLSYAKNQLPGIINTSLAGAKDLLKGGLGTELSGTTGATLRQLMAGGGNKYLAAATSGNQYITAGTQPNEYMQAAAYGNPLLYSAASGNPMLEQAGSGSLSPFYQDVLTGSFNDAARFYGNTIDDINTLYQSGLSNAQDASLMSGNFGGSRGAVSEGIVGSAAATQAGRAQQALGENITQSTADVLNNQFSAAREAQLRAGLGLMETQLAGGLGLMDTQASLGLGLSDANISAGLGLMDANTRAGLGILDAQLGAANAGAGLYNTDIQGKIAAVSALPQIGTLGALPGQLMSGVGAQQRGMQQSLINAQIDRFNFNQARPTNNLNQYLSSLSALGGLGQVQYVNSPGAGAQLAAGLGGGLSGAGTGALLGSVIPGLGTGLGALAGGGVGALAGFLSG